MLGGSCNNCCSGNCPVCTGSTCCGDEWPRQSGECCDGVWRTDEGVCCGGQWYPTGTSGKCCEDVWHTDTGDCCNGVWHSGAGECCGGVWHTDEGFCCAGVWFETGNECPEGQTYFEIITGNRRCCTCVPNETVEAGQGPDSVQWCCDDTGAYQANEYGECKQRCCDGTSCTQVFPSDCTATVFEGTCLQGCPVPCCTENADGIVECETRDQAFCTSPSVVGVEYCGHPSGCLGECCIDGVSQGQTTQADCDAISGDWGGLGSTTCYTGCRSPFTEACCESKQSSAAGLTFTQPRRKRVPPFNDTLRVTVTGTTDSAILIHGTPFGRTEDPPVRCPINHTFLLCWDEFHIEPVPCGTNFHNLDVEVCWSQEHTDAETLAFPVCDGLTITLGDCDHDCVTTTTYIGSGRTSNNNLSLRGNAVIDASGSGPLVLTGTITAPAACVETLTLTGTSTANNHVQSAIPNSSVGLSVIKTGPGLWRLSGASTYGGQLQVLDGTLVVGSAVDIAGGSPFGDANTSPDPVLGSNSPGMTGTASLLVESVAINRGFSVAGAGVGSQQVVVIGSLGSGTTTFSGFIDLGRSVTLQAATGGVARFLSNSLASASPVTITIGSQGNSGTVVLNSTLSGSITAVNVVNGTAQLQSSNNRINSATPVTIGSSFGSATLDLNSRSQSLASITFTGSSNSITSGTLRLENTPTVSVTGTGHIISSLVALDASAAFSGDGSLTISGVSSGTNGITKSGSGTLTLSAANTYTGSTTVSEGTLALPGSLSASSAISIGDATLSCSGGTKSANSVACTGAATISGAMTIGTLSGSGSLTKSGTGTMTLTNASTLSGSVSVSGGSLVVNAIVSGPALVTSATFTPSALTVAFSADPAQGNQFKLLAGSTVQTYSTVTLTGTTKTGTYDSATSTLTIN